MNALKTVVNRGTALRLLLVAVVGFQPAGILRRRGAGGGVAVVNYWSEWCAPCRIEIPMLNILSRSCRRRVSPLLA